MNSFSANEDANQPNMVHDIEVELEGTQLTGRYYIEDGIITAVVEGKAYRCPVGSAPAEDTVRALVSDLLLSKLH